MHLPPAILERVRRRRLEVLTDDLKFPTGIELGDDGQPRLGVCRADAIDARERRVIAHEMPRVDVEPEHLAGRSELHHAMVVAAVTTANVSSLLQMIEILDVVTGDIRPAVDRA